MKIRYFILILVAFTLIFTACSFPGSTTKRFLHLTDVESGQDIWTVEVQPGDHFSIEYIHSVHKTPVIDYYRIESNGEMVLFKTAFSTFGAGMPYESDQPFSVEDGFYVINQLHIVTDRILLRFVPIAEHKLSFNEDTVLFNDLITSGTLVAVFVQ